MLRQARRLAARLVALGRREDGFTMVAVSGVLLIVGLASVAAIAAADGDISQTRGDVDRKEAYAAAEAGLNWYRFRLDRNTEYYNECVGAPVFKDAGVDATQRGNLKTNAKALPASSASYSIELLDYTACTMSGGGAGVKAAVNPTSGMFRVRVNGYSQGAKRSIVANVRRRGFLDFLYFTDFETLDPQLFNPANQTTCSKYKRSPDNRPGSPTCRDIQFVTGDAVAGPLHTNDRLLICGTPAFGRTADDAIEMEGPSPGWSPAFCFPNTPNFFPGQPKPGAAHVGMPPTNTTLAVIAQQGGLRFQGRTQITLEGTGMRVTGTEVLSSGATQVRNDASMSLPPNGVIWVGNSACTSNAYIPANPNSSAAGCADVYLRGNYSEDLTIASEKDIVIAPPGAPDAPTGTPPRGDVTRNGDALLGLIANNFIRIYHPITGNRQEDEDTGNCTNSNGPGSMTAGVTIDAAILSLQHSFFVDSWDCGAKLGNITVNGAIAQKFRGPVGTGGSSGSGTGYLKSYNYDDRLRFRSPPFFLDPVQSPWRLGRVNEQVPAP